MELIQIKSSWKDSFVRKLLKLLIWISFTIYLLFLTIGILFKFRLRIFDFSQLFKWDIHNFLFHIMRSNFVPLKTIIGYLILSDLSFNIRFDNLVGNIMAFIPIGLFIPLLAMKQMSFKKVLRLGFFLSLFYEFVQLILMIGQFDVDDIILNVFGTLIGYTIIKICLFSVAKLNISVSLKYFQ